MHTPRKFMTQIWAANNLTSYSYRFKVVPNGVSHSLGADHFKEVAFVMDNVERVGFVQRVAWIRSLINLRISRSWRN
jgi:carboxylesterase type B